MADKTLTYTLIRSRRKTVALIVQGDGSLVVRAPLRLARKSIDQFVASKADWIDKHRQAVKAHPAAAPAHVYAAGEQFWFLGQRYPLEIVSATAARLLELKDGKFRLVRGLRPGRQPCSRRGTSSRRGRR
jgi:predicted metal-dependent hydrolase